MFTWAGAGWGLGLGGPGGGLRQAGAGGLGVGGLEENRRRRLTHQVYRVLLVGLRQGGVAFQAPPGSQASSRGAGAFIPGVPVQPVVLRYPNKLVSEFSWACRSSKCSERPPVLAPAEHPPILAPEALLSWVAESWPVLEPGPLV